MEKDYDQLCENGEIDVEDSDFVCVSSQGYLFILAKTEENYPILEDF